MAEGSRKSEAPGVNSKSITGGSCVAERGPVLTFIAGNKPIITPHEASLDLLFFRRIFSNLYRRHGDSNGEVPVSVFQRSLVRLFRVLGMRQEEQDFDCEEYDVDGSGAVGWYEFVTCWRKSQVKVKLSFSERIYLAMEDPSTCFVGRFINITVTLLIFISCVGFIIGTLPQFRTQTCDGCEPEQVPIFDTFENVCIVVFTVEYLLRACTAPFARGEFLDYEQILEFVTEHDAPRTVSSFMRFLNFVAQPMNIIDLFVIVPYYLEMAVSGLMASNFAVLRVLRLTRLFRLIKLGKSFEVFEIIIRVFHKSMKMFQVLGVYLVLGLCFSSAAIYFVEGGSWDVEQQTYIRIGHDGKESVSPFGSVPHAFWWCVVTFTTVGYGDVVPVTVLGKVVAACTMLIGILVLAMPISVISMNFSDVWSDWNEERRMNAETMEQDLLSVTAALEGLESRNKLVIELYDDRHGREKPELLGQVKWTTLPLDATSVKEEREVYPLQPNPDKRNQSSRVQGTVSAGFKWTPANRSSDSKTIRGTLEVLITSADGLLRSDWKKAGQRDVYALVHCWPTPPTNLESNGVASSQWKTRTVTGLSPVWEESTKFEFCWPSDWRPEDSSPRLRPNSPKAGSFSNFSDDDMSFGCDAYAGLDCDEGTRRMVQAQGREIEALRQQVSEIHFMLRGLSAHLGVPGPGSGWRADGSRSGANLPALPNVSDSQVDETDEGRRGQSRSFSQDFPEDDALRAAGRGDEPVSKEAAAQGPAPDEGPTSNAELPGMPAGDLV